MISRYTRQEMVYRNALKVWDSGKDFKALLLDDEDVKKYIDDEDIEEIFSLDYHFKYIEDIYNRVFV